MGAMNNVRAMPSPPNAGPLTPSQEVQTAERWKMAAILATEHLLATLKAPLSNPAIKLTPALEPGEIFDAEQMLKRLKSVSGTALIHEYRSWKDREPKMTAGLVRAAKAIEQDLLRRAVPKAFPPLGHEPFNLNEAQLEDAWNR